MKTETSEDSSQQTQRMTIGLMIDECVDVLLLEKGFLYTARELILRPAKTIRRVLAGERGRLNPPLRFMFISVTAIAILMSFTSRSITQQVLADPASGEMEVIDKLTREIEELQKEDLSRDVLFRLANAKEELGTSLGHSAMELFYTWNNVLLTLGVPVFAIGTYLFFRRDYNFAEHLAINAYIHGAQSILAIVFTPLSVIGLQTAGSAVYLACSLGYQMWAWSSLFQLRTVSGWLVAFSLTIIALTIYTVVGIVFITIVMLVTFQSSISTLPSCLFS